MASMLALPTEILDLIIEHLVVAIGIQKAVLLRTVSQAFDSAVLHAICVAQVVDIDDPSTPGLGLRMDSALKGRIIAIKSRSADHTHANHMYLSVVAKVNSVLDSMICTTSPELVNSRHISIAGAVNIKASDLVDVHIETLNLLSGAAIVGNTSVLEMLLGRGTTDLNASSPYFYNPLILAAAHGHLAAVQCLLDHGARLDSATRHWYRPHSRHNLADLADWTRYKEGLIRSASLNWGPPSALRTAVRGGHRDIVRLLLQPEYRFRTDSIEYLRAILAGAQSGCLDLIQALFEVIGKDLSDFPGFGNDLILAAVRFDRKEVVQWLLDKGVDINAVPDHCAVETAVRSGNLSLVRFLMERGAAVNLNPGNESGYVPIEAASRCGQEEVVELLIEHGADPIKALPRAAIGGHARLVKCLLSRFPDLIHQDDGELGRTALHCALLAGNLTAMTLLVGAGVSLHHGHEYPSHLPLNVAKSHGRPWVVSHLISLGAHETDREISAHERKEESRGILVSERTWEWVSKY